MDNIDQAVIIISKDIVKSVIENDSKCVDMVLSIPEKCEMIIPYSCILWGLEMADDASVEGIRTLATLMSRADIPVMDDDTQKESVESSIMLTPDVLLSLLLGIIKSETIGEICTHGIVLTYDAFVVSALLCVKAGDCLDTQNLAKGLANIKLVKIDPETTNKRDWPNQLPEKGISRIRDKSFNIKPQE